MFIFRDVTFKEHIFPYNSHSVNDHNPDDSSDVSTSHNNILTPSLKLGRHSTRMRKHPQWLHNYQSNLSATICANAAISVTDQVVENKFSCFLTALTTNADPVTFRQAAQHDNWVDAMNSELEAREKNGTWIITSLPAGKQAIGCKWLYKIKFKPDGSVDRFTSRQVILGCKQIFGVDYGENFTPVAKVT